MSDDVFTLMLVTNQSSIDNPEYLNFIEKCLKSGINAVQLRIKNKPLEVIAKFGSRLHALLETYNVPLIINDNVALCLQLDADGVHLGQTDGDINQARQILGADKIIGVSVDTFAQLEIANQLPINYVGVGAIFPTNNKPDIVNIWGVKKLQEFVERSKYPVVAIGGINEHNIDLVAKTGVRGIAAISAFHDADDPAFVTKVLFNQMMGLSYDS